VGVLSPFISYEELSDVLVIPLRTLARRMKELSEVGSIRRVGAAKNGHGEVNMI
jgi:DNA-binding Lrp family transcriptional regulator